jgi:hypothetical protein
MNTVQKLTAYVRARYPGVALRTSEEQRACGDLLAVAKECGRSLYSWAHTTGLTQIAEAGEVLAQLKTVPDSEDPIAAMRLMGTLRNALVVICDLQVFPVDRDPGLNRHLRDLLAQGPERNRCCVLLGAAFPLPATIEKLVSVVDYELPDDVARRAIADGIVATNAGKLNPSDVTDAVIRSLGGLTTTEAENALALSYVETKKLDPKVIYREKVGSVRRSGLLEIVDPDPRGLDAIGGFAALKTWNQKRVRAFGDDAAAFGLPAPKGVLIAGVPGTGKSLAAKAIGSALGLPTLRLDVGSLFGSLVGESEQRARSALALAEAISPCVLWLDEIDKGLSGSDGSGDSGTTKRVIGTILSWLQERKASVFMVATANDVGSLPPELYRMGRWDAIWAVDLPMVEERAEIVQVLTAKYGRKMSGKVCTTIAVQMTNFTGAEIEAAIVEGLYAAFDARRELTEADVINAAAEIVPLATMAKEKIDAVRKWSQQNARPVAGGQDLKAHRAGARALD